MGPKHPQTAETHVRVAHQRRAVAVRIRGARDDQREAVIGRSHARRLYLALAHVIDERRFARTVVPQQKHKGKQRVFLRRLLQRTFELVIESLYGAPHFQALFHQPRWCCVVGRRRRNDRDPSPQGRREWRRLLARRRRPCSEPHQTHASSPHPYRQHLFFVTREGKEEPCSTTRSRVVSLFLSLFRALFW